MSPTAEEVFLRDVRGLPLAERLHLASLILQEVTQSGTAIVEQSETWSEQDKQDLAAFSLEYASQTYPEVEDIFAEMAPFTVSVGGAEYSRETFYSRIEGE